MQRPCETYKKKFKDKEDRFQNQKLNNSKSYHHVFRNFLQRSKPILVLKFRFLI